MYAKTIENLRQTIINDIAKLIETKGEKSLFSDEIVLPVFEGNQIELDTDVYCAEIGKDYLISQNGHHYPFTGPDIETLIDIMDSYHNS